MLPTVGGKVENAQNHRHIDARDEAEGVKPVVYVILYYIPTQVGILFFLTPFAENNIFVKTSERKNLLPAGVRGKTNSIEVQLVCTFIW